MKIGLLGSGVVGQALSEGYQRHGHETRISNRDSFVEVAQWADLSVLAVAGRVAEQVAGEVAGVSAGKVLIDATNPLDWSTGSPALSLGFDDSLGERVQRAAPEVKVVKAYNIIGHESMVDPSFDGGPPTMLIAGDDEGAKQTVTELLQRTGWDVADLGAITASRYLEPIALAWILHGVRTGDWHHAFKLLS